MLIYALILFFAACREFAVGNLSIGLALICFAIVLLVIAGVRSILVATVADDVMGLFNDNRQQFYFPHEAAEALKEKESVAPQMWLLQRALDHLCRRGLLEKVMCGFNEKQRPKYRKMVPIPGISLA